MSKTVKHLTPEARAALTREAFDAYATVGFLKWKREEIEQHGTPPEKVEAARASYVSYQKRISWHWFRDAAAKAPDDRLLDVRQDWVDRAAAMSLLDRKNLLTLRYVRQSLQRFAEQVHRDGMTDLPRREAEIGLTATFFPSCQEDYAADFQPQRKEDKDKGHEP